MYWNVKKIPLSFSPNLKQKIIGQLGKNMKSEAGAVGEYLTNGHGSLM